MEKGRTRAFLVHALFVGASGPRCQILSVSNTNALIIYIYSMRSYRVWNILLIRPLPSPQ